MTNKGKDTLVILTPGFPKSESDSTCLPMQQSLVRHLKEQYPQLNIIILSFQYPYYKETYNWFGTTVTSFSGKNKRGISRLRLRQKLYRVLKKINNDHTIISILSFWYGECAFVGKQFADRHKLSHFCWLLGRDAGKENKYPRQLHPKTNELIALSDFLQDEFERNHKTRPQYVIPSGGYGFPIDTGKKRTIDIIAVGSLIPLKRFEIFIDIIAELKKEIPGLKAMLIGDGPEKDKLHELIGRYGLQENCLLTGELPHGGVLELMQRSKILLHPSSYEGFSGVCQEALYNGAHVISFCRAMKQEIEQWHIISDKEAMTKKALAILKDPDTVYKSNDPFPMKDTAKKMMELFTG